MNSEKGTIALVVTSVNTIRQNSGIDFKSRLFWNRPSNSLYTDINGLSNVNEVFPFRHDQSILQEVNNKANKFHRAVLKLCNFTSGTNLQIKVHSRTRK